jgi:hypothetical protein
MINKIYSQDELKEQLRELKSRRESVYNQRKDILQKFSKKTNNVPMEDLHQLELKIEDVERKIKILF